MTAYIIANTSTLNTKLLIVASVFNFAQHWSSKPPPDNLETQDELAKVRVFPGSASALLRYLTGGLDAEHSHSRLRVTLELVHQLNSFRGWDTAVNPYVTSLKQKKARMVSVRQRANRRVSVSSTRENLAKQGPDQKAEAVVIPTMEPLCDWHVWHVCLLFSTAALRILQQWFFTYQMHLQPTLPPFAAGNTLLAKSKRLEIKREQWAQWRV